MKREFRQIELRGFWGAAVDKIRAFSSVFVYFEGLFEGGGRQNSGISHVFVYFEGRAGPF